MLGAAELMGGDGALLKGGEIGTRGEGRLHEGLNVAGRGLGRGGSLVH